MSLGLAVASDIVSAALDFHIKGDALSQTTQNKPLLRILRANQKTFPGGKGAITGPVQGAYMSDSATFLQGYTEDEQITYAQAANLLRWSYNWYETVASWIVSFTELKKDGVSINMGNPREHNRADATRLTSILKNRLDDFTESWARATNRMFWADGSADAQHVPGILSILTDTPAVGTTGGLARATYSWWRHRAKVGASKITASAELQTLTNTLRDEFIQLSRFGGNPTVGLCGSGFITELRKEVTAKGLYTQSGFDGKNNITFGAVRLDQVTFEYDPTLDDLGYAKRCYVIDPRRLTLMPMEQEDNKVITPERPYDYFVYLRNMTWTGGLVASQLNCHGVYEVA